MLTRTDLQAERPRRLADRQRSGQIFTADDGLLAALKAARTRLPGKRRSIFSNATLTDMAAKAPRTIDQFLQVSGVGEVKARRYGAEFMRVISEYMERGKEDAGAEGIH